MRAFLPLVAVLLVAAIPVAWIDAAPVPKDFGDRVEEFEWKGEKRKRTARTLVLGGERMEFVKVPEGSFFMGATDDDQEATKDEKPRHRVTFTKPLWVGKHPVTKGQFAAFVAATKYRTDAEGDGKGGVGFDGKEPAQSEKYSWRETGWKQTDRHPVVNVTWNDAVAYCEWASKESKRTVRLLSEAEYEYANRGGETTRYFTGEAEEGLEGYANVADASAQAKWGCKWPAAFDDGESFSSAVGRYKPNGFGLHDTTGNVWCWCADAYEGNVYESREDGVTDPKPHEKGPQAARAMRGGSWHNSPKLARATYRRSGAPESRSFNYGFRIAFDLD